MVFLNSTYGVRPTQPTSYTPARRPGWRVAIRRALFVVLKHITPCPACQGRGTEPVGGMAIECPSCNGKGTYEAYAEQYARDLAALNGCDYFKD